MPTPFPFVSGAVLTAANLNSISELPTRTLTGSGNAVAADSYSRVILNGTSITYTINTSTFSAGQVVQIYNANSTTATIAAGAGVTLNGAAGFTLAQYQTAELYAVSATSFVLSKSDSPAALTLVKSTTFTNAASVTEDNVFTSSYANYLMLINLTSTGSGFVTLQFRAAGVTTSTNYNYYYYGYNGSTADNGASTSQSAMAIGYSATAITTIAVHLFSPQLAENTYVVSSAMRSGAAANSFGANQTSNTQFDGFILDSAANNTGTVRVYGYANS